MAGLEVEVIYGDDQVKPTVGSSRDEMPKKHQVDFVAGIIWSTRHARGRATGDRRGHVMIGTTPGRTSFAGKLCTRCSSPRPAERRYASRRWAVMPGTRGSGRVLMARTMPRARTWSRVQALLPRVALSTRCIRARADRLPGGAPSCARRPEAVFVSTGGHGISFLRQYRKPGSRQFPCIGVYGGRISIRGEARCAASTRPVLSRT